MTTFYRLLKNFCANYSNINQNLSNDKFMRIKRAKIKKDFFFLI